MLLGTVRVGKPRGEVPARRAGVASKSCTSWLPFCMQSLSQTITPLHIGSLAKVRWAYNHALWACAKASRISRLAKSQQPWCNLKEVNLPAAATPRPLRCEADLASR